MKKKAELEALLVDLKELCEKLQIAFRETSKIRTRGALCTVHGRKVLIVNRNLDLDEKIGLVLDELRGVDLSDVFVKPHIRELFE